MRFITDVTLYDVENKVDGCFMVVRSILICLLVLE